MKELTALLSKWQQASAKHISLPLTHALIQQYSLLRIVKKF